jgi:hypothetical protein
MKRINAILGASGLVLALSLPSWAQEVRKRPAITTVRGFGRGHFRLSIVERVLAVVRL